MEAAVKESNMLGKWVSKLTERFPMLRRSDLEQELDEAKNPDRLAEKAHGTHPEAVRRAGQAVCGIE